MATNITMPQLGESVTEGTISKWLVKPGDKVNKYDPLAEVMTDKVNADVPSSYTGTIKELLVAEDETVAVGTVICTIEAEEVPKELKAEPVNQQKTESVLTTSDDSQKNRYSPAVLKLAQEHDISLENVKGTGKGGRITRKDIQNIIEHGPETNNEEPTIPEVKIDFKKQPVPVPTLSTDVEVPVTGVRKAIAENMVRSKHEAPHAWMMVEVDVTNLVNYRQRVKESFKEQEGMNLTFLPFFIKATVEALKEYPQVNSMWGGNKIIQKKDINVSVAVAAEDALFVPVIKQADEKTIKGLAREVQNLANKARTGQLTLADTEGGTFTINNTGSFGSILSTPIINQPQAAILSIESIVKKPVVIESEVGDVIAIRSMVNLCLSLDHRILDGLICGRFLARVKEKLENMNEKTISIY
ncbi:dihydrolipoamide acetyltransferase family protein [Halalkalibacter urbisdiaboli]|uniref:dihydrolipoamide acetyltransferase family protein n=1 Tax=Halalkalibacter urbisdiaboli TaxID=1960589 RepID=UPI000B44E5A5|nr:dihydrolipoamide acetyltransferase family protein [Halalkalibacter urbisdiaboli]